MASSINEESFTGIIQNKYRKIIPYEKNTGASYVPNELLNLQNVSEPTDQLVRAPQVSSALIRSLRDDIGNHVEMRIQLFWQQILLMYQSGLIHQCAPTSLQIGESPKKTYAAAHSSTLPSLTSKQQNQLVVVTENPYFYHAWNTTVYLPLEVNKIDTRLDLHHRKLHTETALRATAIRILNSVSQVDASLDPKQALVTFLENFLQLINSAINETSEQKEKEILSIYKTACNSYLEQLNNQDELIKKLSYRVRANRVDKELYLKLQEEMLEKKPFFSGERQALIKGSILPSQEDSSYIMEVLEVCGVKTTVPLERMTPNHSVWEITCSKISADENFPGHYL